MTPIIACIFGVLLASWGEHLQDTDEDADHHMIGRWYLADGISPPAHSLLMATTEHRTTNFHGAAGNLRLDFQTIFFSDPKLFELEIFLSTTSKGWMIVSGGMAFGIRRSVLGVHVYISWGAMRLSRQAQLL